MSPEAQRRWDAWKDAPLTWDPVKGGKEPLVCWRDKLDEDLGEDPNGNRFDEIARRVLTGRYYPPDALETFGPWKDEGRDIKPGDRILQRAKLLGISLWAMTEVFAAERTETSCTLGYVTTKRHFGRGIWQATLTRDGDRLPLHVEGISGPASWQFWVGLPFGRYLQRRAWRRAVEEFRVACASCT